jgi:hypothetical protein
VSTSSSRTGVYPSIHPSTYYIYISIYLARCITHSVRYSLARSLISFFPIIIKRAAAAKGRSSESLSATPEVRPSVPQSRPPRRISYLFCKAPSFTDPLRAARRTFRSHGRCWIFSTIASLVLMQSVRRTCSQRFGPLASADGLVFSPAAGTESEATFRKTSCVILAAHCSPLCCQLKLGLGK